LGDDQAVLADVCGELSAIFESWRAREALKTLGDLTRAHSTRFLEGENSRPCSLSPRFAARLPLSTSMRDK